MPTDLEEGEYGIVSPCPAEEFWEIWECYIDGAEEDVVVYYELGRLNRKRIGIRYWSFLFL